MWHPQPQQGQPPTNECHMSVIELLQIAEDIFAADPTTDDFLLKSERRNDPQFVEGNLYYRRDLLQPVITVVAPDIRLYDLDFSNIAKRVSQEYAWRGYLLEKEQIVAVTKATEGFKAYAGTGHELLTQPEALFKLGRQHEPESKHDVSEDNVWTPLMIATEGWAIDFISEATHASHHSFWLALSEALLGIKNAHHF